MLLHFNARDKVVFLALQFATQGTPLVKFSLAFQKLPINIFPCFAYMFMFKLVFLSDLLIKE